jgi:multicomponent Na+:H+ antiporter subunit C
VVLASTGLYLLMERSLTRVALGVILLGNAVNLLLLVVGGPPGGVPVVGMGPVEEMTDPLPQALVLTAIVITLALTAFLLALAYRSWQLYQHDDVQDDDEDRRIARLAAAALPSVEGEEEGAPIELIAPTMRDETASSLEEGHR